MLNEFKTFISRGNVMDLAVGVIIGVITLGAVAATLGVIIGIFTVRALATIGVISLVGF